MSTASKVEREAKIAQRKQAATNHRDSEIRKLDQAKGKVSDACAASHAEIDRDEVELCTRLQKEIASEFHSSVGVVFDRFGRPLNRDDSELILAAAQHAADRCRREIGAEPSRDLVLLQITRVVGKGWQTFTRTVARTEGAHLSRNALESPAALEAEIGRLASL